MPFLRKAVGLNYHCALFRTDGALDPLRSRDDFRLLTMDVDFSTEPFAPVR
jgi:hypothetical protein